VKEVLAVQRWNIALRRCAVKKYDVEVGLDVGGLFRWEVVNALVRNGCCFRALQQ
jgi:hypothetical protein